MLALFGLKGYTGLEIAPLAMVEEQQALWLAAHSPREEDKSDAQRLREAEQAMGMRPPPTAPDRGRDR